MKPLEICVRGGIVCLIAVGFVAPTLKKLSEKERLAIISVLSSGVIADNVVGSLERLGYGDNASLSKLDALLRYLWTNKGPFTVQGVPGFDGYQLEYTANPDGVGISILPPGMSNKENAYILYFQKYVDHPGSSEVNIALLGNDSMNAFEKEVLTKEFVYMLFTIDPEHLESTDAKEL